MNIMFRYMKPQFPQMAIGFLVKFIGTVMDLFLPWILAFIIDDVVPTKDITAVILWGVVMALCAFVAWGATVWANRKASAVARDSIRVLRMDLFTQIEYLSSKQMDNFTEATLISRMTSDTYNIHSVMCVLQRMGVRAPILLFGGIIVTLTLDPVLALVLIATLPFLAITVYFVSKTGIPLYTKHQAVSDVLIRKVRESITGVRVIKALSKVDYEKEQFEKVNNDVVDKEKKAAMTMAVTNPIVNLLLNVGWIFIIIIGAYRVNEGLTEPGKIIAFLTYFTIILNAMLSVTRMFIMLSKAGASGNRIEEVLNSCTELEQVEAIYNESNKESNNDGYHIEFENVSFSYNKNHNNIENVSFKLKKGQTLGIIGATGSGKTTLVNLLMRFYDVDSGVIKIDGRNVKEYSLDELHTMFGVVFQNDMIFEDTVSQNIKLNREVSDEMMREAAECAQIQSRIDTMEEGYDTYLAIKGANLSGGQKQRLLIARALANNPQILILDDSSSALDYKTDATLRNDIKKKFKETTSVIIAQRVSSVMNSDLILVIDEGKVIGKGTHEELMLTCEEYREISKLQMQQ